ncbi:REP-associated tyrosine transposase [Lysobacter sp. 1R34A]|uniref:REP-associated tyrosine transposase n=1 Tax=Lysobacter sp. 1R34A TaxID=3445786 RepID=UPI003EEEF17D
MLDRSLPKAPGHAALRRGRVSEAHHVYLVTFTTAQRRALFADAELARCAIAALLDRRSWERSTLLAWVLMPDHWHGLVELGPRDSLPALVRQLKCCASRRVRAAMYGLPVLDAVWAQAYHDHALRREESLIDAARYVVMNPVRAGLVDDVRAYPHWGAVWSGDAGVGADEGDGDAGLWLG